MRVCVDKDADVDDLSEGIFRMPPPHAPARSELHMSSDEVGMTRQAQADELGYSTPYSLEHAAHRGD
jgi:hypothetical protein